ncbi:MAG TPA: hypothetical protein VJ954_05740, partial [Ignavibacteriaceae bacterium]|nr:hypothetical protein [Ignavibacteriaceae bacterium]
MSHIPSQERVIDPFASYNSNVVNKITEVVTQGADGILTADSLQGTIDSTATSAVTISTGYVVKDDVLIHITTNHQVDFTDVNHFASGQLPTVGGYYYIVLDYQYAKSRPAPVASIQILTPSERSLLTVGSSYFLLKVVELSNSGPHPILNLYDYDPDTPANERKYIKFYAGTERTIPTFAKHTDQSRIAYETNRDKFFFGFKDGWRELSAGGVSVDVNTDSTAVTAVGQLCYVDSNRTAIPAIATSRHTGADIVVLSRGTVSAGTGRGSVAGYVSDVPVETANLIDIGDLLYLSAVDAGTVTNVRPSPFYQVVGRALSQGSSTTPIQMIFSPKVLLAISLEGQISSWLGPDGDGLYYNTIDVSTLDGTNAYACHWFDNETHEELQPEKVKIYAAGDYIRVYFLDSTTIVDYIIMSGATIGSHSEGGGGGSGVSDHALLTDLDYAHAGHTGFAPSPHGNAD